MHKDKKYLLCVPFDSVNRHCPASVEISLLLGIIIRRLGKLLAVVSDHEGRRFIASAAYGVTAKDPEG